MALADDNEADNSIFGVSVKRTSDPVNPPPIDRQRAFMGQGGNLSVPAKARVGSNGGGPSVNNTRPGAFVARRRTLRKG